MSMSYDKVGLETKFYIKIKEKVGDKKNIRVCGNIWTRQGLG